MSRATAASISLGGGRPSAWNAVMHVAQRGHGQDTRGELLGALERVGHQVEHRIGERLERRRGGADLQPAELGEDVARRDHRLGYGALVQLTVDGKRLGGGRRPNRQLELGGIGARRPLRDAGLLGRGDLEASRARADGVCREAHLDAVVGRHDHALAEFRNLRS